MGNKVTFSNPQVENTYRTLEMIEYFLDRKIELFMPNDEAIGTDTLERFQNDPQAQAFFSLFFKRHPRLQNVQIPDVDDDTIRDATREKLGQLYAAICEKYKSNSADLPNVMENMDRILEKQESGNWHKMEYKGSFLDENLAANSLRSTCRRRKWPKRLLVTSALVGSLFTLAHYLKKR